MRPVIRQSDQWPWRVAAQAANMPPGHVGIRLAGDWGEELRKQYIEEAGGINALEWDWAKGKWVQKRHPDNPTIPPMPPPRFNYDQPHLVERRRREFEQRQREEARRRQEWLAQLEEQNRRRRTRPQEGGPR